MRIEHQYLTINPYSRPGKKLKSVRGVVIHWVANPLTTALQNRNYFESLRHQKSTYASAHAIIGLCGEIVVCVPPDEMAYHVGAQTYPRGITEAISPYPNDSLLGVELCHIDWTGRMSSATYASAVEYCATLVATFGLDPRRAIYRHFDITGKICPCYFVVKPQAWAAYIDDVERAVIALQ